MRLPAVQIREALAILAAASLSACGPSTNAAPAAQREAAPVGVTLARVVTGSLPRTVRATGTLDAQEVVTVSAEVEGQIVALFHDVGDRVTGGERLAQIDDADYLLDRDQKARSLAEALAKLGLASLPEGEVDFTKLPSVERARLESANAKAKLERIETLRNRTPPLISEQDYADVRTAWEVAVSGERLALMEAHAGLATARTRRAELDMAEKHVRDALHPVPGAGGAGDVWLVAARLVAAGDRVSEGAPLFRLVDPDPLRLRVQVPERRMQGVAVGLEAKVWIAASTSPITGRIARIRPEVDLRTRSVDVEIAVANAELALAAGAFASAEIEIGTDDGVLLVPESSVRRFAGVRKVFTVADGKTVERLVVLGRSAGGRVEVTEGLKAGDEVVLDPPASLVAGAAVIAERK